MLILSIVFGILIFISSCANIVIDEISHSSNLSSSISIFPTGRSFKAGDNQEIHLSVSRIEGIDPRCINIYYTLDNSSPDCGTNAILYTTPFIVTDNTDVKAVACCNNKIISTSVKEHYNFVDFEEQWKNVGALGFTPYQASNQKILIDSNDNTIIAQVQEISNFPIIDYYIRVTKFNEATNSWENLGTDNFKLDRPEIAIAENKNGTLYIVYSDNTASGRATVRKFDGTNWLPVGPIGFTSNTADYFSMAFDANNVPYITYRNWTGNYAEVMYFDESSNKWNQLGGAASPDAAYHENILIDKDNNKIYLAYYDEAQSNRISVVYYDSISDKWLNLGHAGFSNSTSLQPKLAQDSNKNLYVAYRDTGYTQELRVMKFNKNSNTWESLTNDPISDGSIDWPDLYIAPDDTIYVAYRDNYHNRVLAVKKLKNDVWESINTNISPGEVSYVSLRMSSNGAINVTFRDYVNTNKTTCMKFSIMPKTPNINLYNRTFVNNTDNFISFTTEEDVNIYYTTDGSDPYINENLAYHSKFSLNAEDTSIELKAIANSNVLPDSSRQINTKYIFRPFGDWHSLGNFAFSESSTSFTSIATDSNDDIYVAFQDYYHNGKLSVMKFNKQEDKWEYLGNPGITSGQVNNTSITIHNNIVYVGYRDMSIGNKASVVTFNGNSWNIVGDPGFSTGAVWNLTLKTNKNGNLYVAYMDRDQSSRATVMTFEGTKWQVLGKEGFSTGYASDLSFVIAPNGTPYVAYRDQSNSHKLTVMSYSGSWQTVGPAGFTDGYSPYPSIAINSSNIPYVAYRGSNNGRSSVVMFNGTDWVSVGTDDFTPEYSGEHSLIMINDVPYLAALDGNSNINAFVFNGTNWETLGHQVSEGITAYVKMAADSTGKPYITYMDRANRDKATVMKLGY